jgi:hypothetical protein
MTANISITDEMVLELIDEYRIIYNNQVSNKEIIEALKNIDKNIIKDAIRKQIVSDEQLDRAYNEFISKLDKNII